MTEDEPRPRASLQVELIAMLAIVLVMAVVSLSFVAEWLGQRRHDAQEVERLQSHARSLSVLAGRSFANGGFQSEQLDELLSESSAQLGVSYELARIRSDGEFERLASVGIHAGFEALPAPSTELASRVDDSLLDRYNLLIIDEPIQARDGQRVNLRMIAEHSAWARNHAWREMLFVAGGVGVLLLLLGTLLLRTLVLQPMRALKQAVSEAETGRLDAEAPTAGPREFAELGAAFNQMLRSLAEQREALANQAQALERSQRLAAVGRLAAGVAHEVGNPLAAIVGYTEIMLGGPELDDEDRDLLERIQAQTQRIQTIVAQLLDYSKPAKIHALVFAPLARCREITTLLAADPRCAGVEFVLVGDPELQTESDPGLVEQILINLVLNAAQAMAAAKPAIEAPTIELVSGIDEHDQVFVEVRDNGPGVAKDARERLFEPFFTTRSAGEGTGLGLAISQGLAESMDGSLAYRGPSKTGGACFRATLGPRANPPR